MRATQIISSPFALSLKFRQRCMYTSAHGKAKTDNVRKQTI